MPDETEAVRQERSERIRILTQMLLGYGIEATDDRLRWLAKQTVWIPLALFERAVRMASIDNPGSFPPHDGQIMRAARKLSTSGTVHDGYSDLPMPSWYRAFLQRQATAQIPLELAPRGTPEVDIGGSAVEGTHPADIGTGLQPGFDLSFDGPGLIAPKYCTCGERHLVSFYDPLSGRVDMRTIDCPESARPDIGTERAAQ